jgi:hypothetical protein
MLANHSVRFQKVVRYLALGGWEGFAKVWQSPPARQETFGRVTGGVWRPRRASDLRSCHRRGLETRAERRTRAERQTCAERRTRAERGPAPSATLVRPGKAACARQGHERVRNVAISY